MPKGTIHNVCRDSLRELRVYLPILGFVLRATNVRNAFEAHDPLQRLTNKVMGTDAKLIISSEWEFSPFVYRAGTGPLSGFVLIGLPAPESSNPLLLPLAGHELGHSIWEHERFSTNYEQLIEEGILKELINNRWSDYNVLYPQYRKEDIESGDMFAQQSLRPAYTWAKLQVEEMFCDFFGVCLFAESFLYAFAYLLSPGTSGLRSLRYPNITRRVSHHVQAAKVLGVNVDAEYESSFEKELEPADPATALLVSLADVVSASFEGELIKLAKNFASKNDVPEKNLDNVRDISKLFSAYVMPIKKPASLVDIMNAGWECNMNENLWEGIPQIKGIDEKDTRRNRDRILRDIILKSMEIAEIYERLEKPA
ncbi:MAG: hypothetical protein NT178_16495 [Proteobacteria bacterium]|nr:hypothetical protein [Pseudomonadota bacterium]